MRRWYIVSAEGFAASLVLLPACGGGGGSRSVIAPFSPLPSLSPEANPPSAETDQIVTFALNGFAQGRTITRSRLNCDGDGVWDTFWEHTSDIVTDSATHTYSLAKGYYVFAEILADTDVLARAAATVVVKANVRPTIRTIGWRGNVEAYPYASAPCRELGCDSVFRPIAADPDESVVSFRPIQPPPIWYYGCDERTGELSLAPSCNAGDNGKEFDVTWIAVDDSGAESVPLTTHFSIVRDCSPRSSCLCWYCGLGCGY